MNNRSANYDMTLAARKMLQNNSKIFEKNK
jgi:hypothetical protein